MVQLVEPVNGSQQSAWLWKPVRLFTRSARLIATLVRSVFGHVMLILGLGIASAVPVLQVVVLGYMTRLSVAVAKRGRLWGPLSGAPLAGRVGGVAIVAGLALLPAFLIRSYGMDLDLIDPGSPRAERWRLVAGLVGAFAAIQIVFVCLRGCRFRYLFRPVDNIRWLWSARSRWPKVIVAIRELFSGATATAISESLRIGVWAYLATIAWLAVPATLLRWGPELPIFIFLGSGLLAWVITLLPMMQMRYADENRLRVFGEVRETRSLCRRAPLAYFLSVLVWLALAIPFYLLLIEEFPPGLLWIPGLVFVLTVLPGRWLSGWAYGRALRRQGSVTRWIRWPAGVLTFAAAWIFSFLVFFTPYIAFRGRSILLEMHPLLFPILR